MDVRNEGDTQKHTGESNKDSAELPVPQAILQPPDYFTGSKPEVKNQNIASVISVGTYKVISGETISVVDQSGVIQPLPEKLGVNHLPDTKTILEEALKADKKYIAFVEEYSQNSNLRVPEMLKKKYPDLDANQIQELIVMVKRDLQARRVEITDSKYTEATDVKNIIDTIPYDKHEPAKLLNSEGDDFQVINPPRGNFRVTTSEALKDWKAIKLSGEPNATSQEVKTAHGPKVRKYPEGKARLFDERNQQLLVLPDTDPSLDPEDNSTIWLVNDEKVMSLDGKKIATGSYEFSEAKLPPEIVKCLAVDIDPHGNFLIVTHEGDTGKKLAFLDKKTLSLIEEVEGVNKPPIVDQEGNVVFIDTNNQLRIVVTNFDHFPTGYGAKIAEIQEKRMAAFRMQIASLELPEVNPATTQNSRSESAMKGADAAIVALNQKLESMFQPLIESATTDADIQTARLQLQTIMNKPEYSAYQIASSTIDRNLDLKTAQLRANKLGIDLESLTAQIPMIKTLEGSLALTKELERIQALRNETNFLLVNHEETKKLQEKIKEVEGKVQEIQQDYQGELVISLQSGFSEVQQILGSAQTLMEMEEARKDPAVRKYLEKINMISDSKQRAEIRKLYSTAVEARQQEIENVLSTRGESRKARAAEIAADIEGTFKSLERNIDGILQETGGAMNLNAWKEGSATVADVRERIRQLPIEYQEGYMHRIEEMIIQKQKTYQQQVAGTENKYKNSKGATVKFGTESFPVYQIPLLNVTPGWSPLDKGMTSKNDRGELVFRSTTGEVWKTGEFMVMNMDDQQRQQKYELLRKKAEARFNPKRFVPEIPENMVLSPYQEKKLEEMTKLFRRQLGLNKNLIRERNPQGITIIQGDAGVGKDYAIDIFAAATNREIISVPCRFSMDAEDLTSEYRFNPKRGTFRVKSQFAQALTKPGTIINFIEINTMPPEVSKMLNPVFDFKRKLYFTQGDDPDSIELNVDGVGQEIKVDPSVIVVGTMNYENYLGTKRLPQEFKSRARFMDYDYPPYRVAKNSKGEEERLAVEQTSLPSGYTEMKISPDEAMILAKQVDTLKSLSSDEFKKLWDHKINKQAGNGADMFDNPERSKAIENLNQVVKIANKMRQAYRSFQTNQPGAEVFEFVFSIRESQDIIAELVETGSVKTAVADVVLPKIPDAEQKKRALDIIQTS